MTAVFSHNNMSPNDGSLKAQNDQRSKRTDDVDFSDAAAGQFP